MSIQVRSPRNAQGDKSAVLELPIGSGGSHARLGANGTHRPRINRICAPTSVLGYPNVGPSGGTPSQPLSRALQARVPQALCPEKEHATSRSTTSSARTLESTYLPWDKMASPGAYAWAFCSANYDDHPILGTLRRAPKALKFHRTSTPNHDLPICEAQLRACAPLTETKFPLHEANKCKRAYSGSEMLLINRLPYNQASLEKHGSAGFPNSGLELAQTRQEAPIQSLHIPNLPLHLENSDFNQQSSMAGRFVQGLAANAGASFTSPPQPMAFLQELRVRPGVDVTHGTEVPCSSSTCMH